MGVNLAAAESIGRTLARLGELTARRTAEPDTSREVIVRIVQEADGAVSIEDISQVTGLHANTIRTHLEVLRAAGRVERRRDQATGRGRPRWLYSAVETDDPYHRLAKDLEQALAQAQDSETAAAAAQRWRAADQVGHEPVDTPDEAVAAAAQALARLGFEVDVSPVGDALYLGQCPYAPLIREHPVICDIHAAALDQVLADTGQDVTLASMDVFPRPGVCVAHLRRVDTAPMRVIPGTDDVKTAKKSRRQA